ncbi:MAG: hypothetical protein R3F11_27745 [Verrucomicrobiales bacterium]
MRRRSGAKARSPSRQSRGPDIPGTDFKKSPSAPSRPLMASGGENCSGSVSAAPIRLIGGMARLRAR